MAGQNVNLGKIKKNVKYQIDNSKLKKSGEKKKPQRTQRTQRKSGEIAGMVGPKFGIMPRKKKK